MVAADVRRRVEIAEMSACLRRRLRVPGILKHALRRRSRRGDEADSLAADSGGLMAVRSQYSQSRSMLQQSVHELELRTRGRGFYEFTDQVEELVAKTGFQTGLATLHLQHTSASLLIQENADPEVRRDLERFFSRLAPDGDPLFQHTSEGDDDMPAHVRTALTTVNLSIPIQKGRLTLGTWQGIYLWEHRLEPHQRRVTVHLIGE